MRRRRELWLGCRLLCLLSGFHYEEDYTCYDNSELSFRYQSWRKASRQENSNNIHMGYRFVSTISKQSFSAIST
jgi:hypothetical protein